MPSHPPLILIHGMSSGPQAWAPVLSRLEQQREVHVVTLPGHHGRPIPRDFSSSTYVDLVEAELDRLGIEAPDVVGNSLGGWIALQLAARGRARSVVCLAPAGGWPVGSPFDRLLTAQFAAAYRVCRMLVAPAGRPFRRTPGVRRALLHAMVARPQRVSPRAFDEIVADVAGCRALRESLHRPAARDLAFTPAAPCPVLIAWSAEDRILVSHAYRRTLAEQVGAPTVVTLPGVGHIPMSDEPDLVARTILEFTA
ncbi:MAG: alpha/beta hydrolase [Nocardioides sp.]|uniref:alpha/beta fold hydrolase n=1 Tax=Nocardioides sp. TaxID=35761 RepID=UPI0039E4DBAC